MTSLISPRTLIEAFLPAAGDVDLLCIYDTANQVGIEDQPVRLALRRLIAVGDIEQHGRGRAGRIWLTDVGRSRLASDRLAVQLAFAQDAGHAPWGGKWRLLGFSAPGPSRAIRDAFRRRVAARGAAALSTGLYVTPHDLSSLVSPQAVPYLVTAEAETLTVRGLTEPREIVEHLWPADATIDAYSVIARTVAFGSNEIAHLSEAAALTRQLHLAEALEHALRNDPLIPHELRVGRWEPAHLRRRWLESWHEARRQSGGDLIYRGWLPE